MEEENPSSELKKEFLQKKQEVFLLRNQLSSLRGEKEKVFQEMRSFQSKIISNSEKIKKLKGERDALTAEVRALKGERDKLNEVVKEKATLLKEVDKKKIEPRGEKREREESPGYLRSQIARLETKIETEVMAYSKEQQIRKMLKELRSKYKEVEGQVEVLKEHNSAAADFSQVRREAQESHHGVQEKAQQSQEKHEQIQKLFEEVKGLRDQERPLAEKNMQLRVQFEQLKKTFQETQERVKELAKVFHEEEEKSYSVRVREKTAEVQEKLKRGKKLSTEDILAFQAMREN